MMRKLKLSDTAAFYVKAELKRALLASLGWVGVKRDDKLIDKLLKE